MTQHFNYQRQNCQCRCLLCLLCLRLLSRQYEPSLMTAQVICLLPLITPSQVNWILLETRCLYFYFILLNCRYFLNNKVSTGLYSFLGRWVVVCIVSNLWTVMAMWESVSLSHRGQSYKIPIISLGLFLIARSGLFTTVMLLIITARHKLWGEDFSR